MRHVSGPWLVWPIVILVCLWISGCASKYYVPPSIKGTSTSELVRIDVSAVVHTTTVVVDGVEPIKLFGSPRRFLYLPPGRHEMEILNPKHSIKGKFASDSLQGPVIFQAGSYGFAELVYAFEDTLPGQAVVLFPEDATPESALSFVESLGDPDATNAFLARFAGTPEAERAARLLPSKK